MSVAILGKRQSGPELGHLSQVIADHLQQEGVDLVIANDVSELIGKDIRAVIHSRKAGEQLQGAADYCQETGADLVNLSTGLKVNIPEDATFTYVEAPNIALRVLQFMIDLEEDAKKYKDWNVSLVEHHQEAKTSVPGTAVKMAGILGLDDSEIVSIRDWKASQEEFEIPDENQGGYGIHKITFSDPSGEQDDVIRTIKVFGRKEYAEGTMQVLDALDLNEKVPTGLISIVDFVREGLHEVNKG